MEKLAKNIEELGLETKEAKIYLAALHLGGATVSDLAGKSGLKRTTVHFHLNTLVRKNFLYKTAKGKRIMYIAQDPQKMLKVLEKKKKHYEKILPELESIYSYSSHKPRVRYYEGIEGMREIYNELTKTSQTVYGVFSAEKYFSVFSEKDNDEFFKNIKENGGQIKDIIEDSKIGRKHAKSKFYGGLGSPKILPEDFNVAVDLMVAGDKTAMISLVNLVGVVIENAEIAELQRNFVKFMRRNLR